MMRKVRFLSVVMVVFFLSTGFASAQYWDTDGDDIVNTNSGAVSVNGRLNVGNQMDVGGTLDVGSNLTFSSIMPGISIIYDTYTTKGIYFLFDDIIFGNWINPYMAIEPNNSRTIINGLDFIVNGGKLGIGTSSPNQLLSLRGTDANLVEFQDSSGAIKGFIGHAYSDGQIITNSTDGDMVIRTENQNIHFTTSSNSAAQVTIKNGGNVGIGTSDPGSYKLAVLGKIRAEEVVVETNWSDFVFEKDYNLPTLDKVESYIKENKHLPDIPSEKEIKEEGLSMASMMAKHMQKIEELTLYMIELKKENNRLNERLAIIENDKN